MKEINITINESDIMSRIFAESGYAALARAKSGMPERFTDIVQATDDDRSTIRRFIADSMGEAAGTITRYMSPCTVRYIGDEYGSNGTIYVRFVVPQNSPDGMAQMLKESITVFSTARSLQHWMLMVKPDEANIHLGKAPAKCSALRLAPGTPKRRAKRSITPTTSSAKKPV